MFEIVCVTNRKLCEGDFLSRIDKVACAKPSAIILREKDLPQSEYKQLALSVLDVCNKHGVRLILHTYAQLAKELNMPVHLPMFILKKAEQLPSLFGASCHSVTEAIEAQKLGCSYITAGHIFDTDCKRGTPGRGLEFLRSIVSSVSIPVYAIGGINAENIRQVAQCNAHGACVMSGAMTGESEQYIFNLKKQFAVMAK